MRKILFTISVIASTLLMVTSCSDDGDSIPEAVDRPDVNGNEGGNDEPDAVDPKDEGKPDEVAPDEVASDEVDPKDDKNIDESGGGADISKEKELLKALIKKAEKSSVKDGMTTESKNKLQKAKEKAKEVLANSKATIKQVKEAKKNLEDAIKILKVDKSSLKNAISQAKKAELVKGKTEKSIKSLQDVVKKAQAVYDKEKTTIAEIEDAIKSIDKAKRNLVSVKTTGKSDYIGKWKVAKVFSENGKITGTKFIIAIDADLTITGKDYNMNVVFEDKKISNSGSFNVVINAKQGILLDQSFDKKVTQFPTTEVDWVVENNVVKIENNGRKLAMDIISSSDDKIVVSYPLNKLVSEKELLESKGISDGKIKGNIIVELTK